MKKVVIFSVLFFTFLVACNAQNVNYEQRIVGTWIQNSGGPNSGSYDDGKTWVFNANGTFTCGDQNGKYSVAGTRMSYFLGSSRTYFFDISISSDGKTLIITSTPSTDSTGGYWLTKK